MDDQDGDGYPNAWEKIWGSDPLSRTIFEDLKNLPNNITGTIFVREPYNVDDMNSTVYQQVNVISESIISDREGEWLTLEAEIVLFPNAARLAANYATTLAFPYPIKPGYENYLSPTATSDTCALEHEMMEPIIESSTTLHQLANAITSWNSQNLRENPDWLYPTLSYRENVHLTTCIMMEAGKTAHSTTRAIKTVSDFREAGIPSGIAYSLDPTDVDRNLHEQDLANNLRRSHNHPQTAIWTPDLGWIIYDYSFGILGARNPPYYTPLVILAIVPDFSDLDLTSFFNMEDGVFPAPDWLYFTGVWRK